MALNNTYFEPEKVYEPLPIPTDPGYVPPTPPTPPTPDPGSVPSDPLPALTTNISCTLYVNSDEPNKVTKTLTSGVSVDYAVKGDVDIQHPVFYLDGDYSGYNYMQMGDKYYYCDCTACPGNLTKISGKVDVLMTYSSVIRSHTAVIERNANVYNKYLNDTSFKTYAYKNTRTLKFPTGFSKTLNWLLVAIGGQDSGGGE